MNDERQLTKISEEKTKQKYNQISKGRQREKKADRRNRNKNKIIIIIRSIYIYIEYTICITKRLKKKQQTKNL